MFVKYISPLQISNLPFVDQYTAHTLIAFMSGHAEVKRPAPAKCDSVWRNNYLIKCDFPVFSSQCVCLPMFSSPFPSIMPLVTEMKQPWFPVRWEDSSRSTGRIQDACHNPSTTYRKPGFFPGLFRANASLQQTVKHLSWTPYGDFKGGTVVHKYVELFYYFSFFSLNIFLNFVTGS